MSYPAAFLLCGVLTALCAVLYMVTRAAMSGKVDANELAIIVGVAGTVTTSIAAVGGYVVGRRENGNGKGTQD